MNIQRAHSAINSIAKAVQPQEKSASWNDFDKALTQAIEKQQNPSNAKQVKLAQTLLNTMPDPGTGVFASEVVPDSKKKRKAVPPTAESEEASSSDEGSESASDLIDDLKNFVQSSNSPNRSQWLAQVPANQTKQPAQNQTGIMGPRLQVTPFQLFLDKAVDFFDMVSGLEEKGDSLMQDYIDGKVSIEELSLIRTKVSVALSFTTTLVNQITQTFKEIQNMQV